MLLKILLFIVVHILKGMYRAERQKIVNKSFRCTTCTQIFVSESAKQNDVYQT